MPEDAYPQIYLFHVDEIRNVTTPEELQEWEEHMARRVKLAGFSQGATEIGTATTSCCGGRCDDCDQHPL